MEFLSQMWRTNKALVITGVLGLLVVVYLVYKSASSSGAGGSPGTGTTSAPSTPTAGGGTSPFVIEDIHQHSGPAQTVMGPPGPAGVTGPVGARGPKGNPAPKPVHKPAPKPVPKKRHVDPDDHDTHVHKATGAPPVNPLPLGTRPPARGVR